MTDKNMIAQTRASQLVQIGVAANGDLTMTQDWMAYCTILRQAGKEPTDAQGDAFDFAWNAARASQPEGATGTTGAPDEWSVIAQLPDIHTALVQAYRAGALRNGPNGIDADAYAEAERAIRAWNLPDAAPASAQPDRGAAQFCQHCGYDHSVGPLCKTAAALSPASQPVAPEADEPDHGETVLRVQGLLGITQTGWVSPDVIELRIEQLKKAAHAQQEAAPAVAVYAGVEFTRYTIEWTNGPLPVGTKLYAHPIAAAPPSDAKDATVPDHSEREAANAGGHDKRDLEGALKMVAQSRDILASALALSQERVEKLNATIAAGQEAANATDAARWRFMLAVADDENSPEAKAMEPFARDKGDVDYRPESVQMTEIVDKARAAMAAAPSSEKGGTVDVRDVNSKVDIDAETLEQLKKGRWCEVSGEPRNQWAEAYDTKHGIDASRSDPSSAAGKEGAGGQHG